MPSTESPGKKEIVMRHFVSNLIVTGIFLTIAVKAFSQSLNAEVKDYIKETAIVPTKPAENTTTAPTSVEIPVVKNRSVKGDHKRKRASRRHISPDRAQNGETAPDERLSIKQVMELLKTTRNFAGKNLSGLRLVALDLTKCNLKGANLSKTDLERADLEESNLELADLSGANLKMTDLRITGIKGAKLDSAIFDGAIWQDGTVCAKSSISFCREHTDKFRSN